MAEHVRSISACDRRPAETPGAAPILVVDDDPVILSLVAGTLEDEGYKTVTAPHGAAALELLARRREAGEPPPASILLDMRMPIMDGWAFAEAYRRTSGPHAPIVVVTAAHDAADRAAEIDADAVLAKPFDLDELVAVVERCAGRGARPAEGRGSVDSCGVRS
jgi:CheY-like chemotaxis protein